MLDSYFKDIVGSFLLFFVAIGPVVYYSAIKKEGLPFQGSEENGGY